MLPNTERLWSNSLNGVWGGEFEEGACLYFHTCGCRSSLDLKDTCFDQSTD